MSSVFGFQVCLCGGSGKTRKERMKTISNIHRNNRFISIDSKSPTKQSSLEFDNPAAC